MEETEQASEPDCVKNKIIIITTYTDTPEMLELSIWEFKTTMNNMLRDLMEKVEIIWEQMDNIRRKMDILMKNQKQMLEI